MPESSTSLVWALPKPLPEYGWFRGAEGNNPSPHTLIVFVHGLMGHCVTTWNNLPRFLADATGDRFDMFSFWYPAKLLEAADYHTAATELGNQLRQEKYRRYRNLIFVVHSTGGLIVKELLAGERQLYEQLQASGTLAVLSAQFLTFRTRRIVNLGVPHEGGSWFATVFTTITAPLMGVVGGLGWVVSSASSFFYDAPRKRLGVNRIPFQLTWWVRDLRQLDVRYTDFLRVLDGAGLPRPQSVDYLGDNDRAIALQRNYDYEAVAPGRLSSRSTDRGRVLLRGTHKNIKVPDHADDDIVRLVVVQINECLDDVSGMVAEGSVALAQDVDRGLEIRVMIPEVPPGDEPLAARRSVGGTWVNGQREVLDQLANRVRVNRNGPATFLVTGGAGVGKSAVLRRLGTNLAADALLHGTAKNRPPLPIVMPLFRYWAEDDKRFERLKKKKLDWDELAAWWCDWVGNNLHLLARDQGWGDDEIGKIPKVTPKWLNEQLKQYASVMVWDGVDDFLLRYPNLSLRSVLDLAREVLKLFALNSRLSLVIGLRDTFAVADMVPPENALEIARLSEAQGRKFPELIGVTPSPTWLTTFKRLLHDAGIPSAKRLLLTPLILTKLILRERAESAPPLDNANKIFTAALDVLIDQGKLNTDTTKGGHRSSLWLDALTVVAWEFFAKSSASRGFDELSAAVKRRVTDWEDHSNARPDDHGLAKVLEGFRLAKNDTNLKTILEGSVFVGVGVYRFAHREWEEFLAARHLYYSVLHEYVKGLIGRGTLTRMHFLVEEMLEREHCFERNFVEAVHDVAERDGLTTGKPSAQIPIGNLLGAVGYSKARLDPRARDFLFEHYLNGDAKAPRLVELVALSTAGFRAQREQSGVLNPEGFADAFAAQLRDKYPGSPGTNLLVNWAAGCFERKLNLQPSREIPRLDLSDRAASGFLGALDFVSTSTHDGKREVRPLDRSMQQLFVRMLDELEEHSEGTIGYTTYLVCIVAASLYGLAEIEVNDRLPRALAKDSPVYNCIASYADKNDLGELIRVWDACRERYEEARLVSAPSNTEIALTRVERNDA